MTSQAADRPETAVASRRSKLTPEREQEFFDAVLEQIRQCGYDSVTMEGVAASTRCSKSTLYRQWKTKPQFVAAALRARRSVRFAGIDTGTLAGDLREVARQAGEGYVIEGRLFQALGHAVVQDEELQAALRGALVEPEICALRAMVDRAVARGEVPADHPALEFIPAQIFGVLRARPVLDGQDADETYIIKFMEAAVLPTLGLT
ncbi:TetR/AcrR family transcriptional regulator [Streptomyces capitiformicae]|uniref:TetR family transcriptional regulator n=1 Tax=Streptomyces capitiformicae TaxID=2014920 RepID=A0A918ZRI5_9ACTN|nr:TetR/AcrR family transcriptional regulator [Streptomyces capitiformicae]GHE66702.1 TetR family transcriptional regulator [Streptomyces capitiformicae]